MFGMAIAFMIAGIILIILAVSLKLAAVLIWLGVIILVFGGAGYLIGKGFHKGNR